MHRLTRRSSLRPTIPRFGMLHFELLARTRSWDAAGKSLDAIAGPVPRRGRS